MWVEFWSAEPLEQAGQGFGPFSESPGISTANLVPGTVISRVGLVPNKRNHRTKLPCRFSVDHETQLSVNVRAYLLYIYSNSPEYWQGGEPIQYRVMMHISLYASSPDKTSVASRAMHAGVFVLFSCLCPESNQPCISSASSPLLIRRSMSDY